MRDVADYFGAEKEQMVAVVESGPTEGIIRARGGLGLVTVWETEKGKENYKLLRLGYGYGSMFYSPY